MKNWDKSDNIENLISNSQFHIQIQKGIYLVSWSYEGGSRWIFQELLPAIAEPLEPVDEYLCNEGYLHICKISE